jgi:hypothetical protein
MKKKGNRVAKQIPKERRYRDPAEWLAELKRFGAEPLLLEGRNQPILRGSIDAEKKRFFKLADRLPATSDPAKRKTDQGSAGAHGIWEELNCINEYHRVIGPATKLMLRR